MPKRRRRRRGCGFSQTKYTRKDKRNTKEQIAGQLGNTCSSNHDKPSTSEIEVIMLNY